MMRRILLAATMLLILPVGARADQTPVPPSPDPMTAPAPAVAALAAPAPGAVATPGSLPALAAAAALANPHAPVASTPLAAPTALAAPGALTRMPEAPAPWAAQDPADSLYRAAREAMNRGEYERAATLFHQVWNRHPRSAYASDAPYWEAFNRYRTGDTDELERALELLEVQRERYEDAATRRNGEASSLQARITGQLARRGNVSAAAGVVAAANAAAGLSAGFGAQMGMRMEAMAVEMAARGEMLAEQLATSGAAMGRALGMALGGGSSADVPEECRDQVDAQLAALNALINMNAERSIPVLQRVMERRDECAAPLRRRAIFLIADKRSPQTIELLLTAARTDPDLEVRRQAVFWLSEVDDPRAVSALEGFLAESDDDQIRERAIFALSQHDSPQARQVLRRVAGDRAMPVGLRSKAIFWLGNEGGPEDIEFLKGLFGRLGDPKLDERILFSVGQAEREADARWLLAVASDDAVAPALRRTAIFWAAEAGAPAAALGDLYDRLEDRALKERIIFGLSESSDPAAIDRLIRIVRNERNPELRQKAIFWLGQSNDPRAADVLMEILLEPRGGGR